MLSTYAQACTTINNNTVVVITIRHERGIPVQLASIQLKTDKGLVTYTVEGGVSGHPSVNASIEGFNGRLGAGQVGYVKMSFPSGYFTLNNTYSGIVFFDAGNTVITFQVVKCPFITYPYPTTLLNLGLTATTGTILALGLLRTTTPGIDIELYSRANVFYNDTFKTDPFTTGRLNPANCATLWMYDTTRQRIYISLTEGSRPGPGDHGGECIVLINQILPQSGTIYIAVVASTNRGEGRAKYVDVVYYGNRTAFYTLGVYEALVGGKAVDTRIQISRYLNEWRTLNSSSFSQPSPYGIVGSYRFTTGDLGLWVNQTTYTSARDTLITPIQVGLGVNHSKARVDVYFDNLLVTINAPPWFVNVTNVPRGWRVVLRDQSGVVISEGVSINGNISLGVWGYFIVENTVFELYDDRGSLVASRRFEYVMGGEVYRVVMRETLVVEEFTVLATGIGGSSKILLYNVTSLENISFIREVDAYSVFDGATSIAIGSGALYLLNTSGVYMYDFASGAWSLATSMCRSSGLGAGLTVIGETIVVVPGIGNNALCVYNTTSGSVLLYSITEGVVTEYTCLASSGSIVYASLLSNTGPVIVAYNVTSGGVSVVSIYRIRDYRLYGLTHDGTGYLYYIQPYSDEYGVVYRLDTLTGEVEILSILLYPTPYTLGNRLVYYSNHLIYARSDNTNELYITPLEYAFW